MWPLLLPKDFSMKDDLESQVQVWSDWVSAGYSYDVEYIWYNDPETPGRHRQKQTNKQKKP